MNHPKNNAPFKNKVNSSFYKTFVMVESQICNYIDVILKQKFEW
jgi:hypothetical protein